MNENIKVAIFSPSKDSYSETFIQSHRGLFGGNTVFYHGPINDIKIEDKSLVSFGAKVFFRLVGRLLKKNYFLDISYSVKKSLQRNKVDFLLIEYGVYGADLLPYLSKWGIPYVVHFHGYDASVYSVLEKHSSNYKIMFASAKKIIVVSKAMFDQLLSLGCPSDRLVLNTYGPHPSFYEVSPDYKSLRIISVGRFVNKKAPYYLIEIIRALKGDFPDVKLDIVGDGFLKEACCNLLKHHELSDCIKIHGVLDKKQIIDLMNNASCYIQHSVRDFSGDMEGTPLSILEAGAAGLPVVSTMHAGIGDVVQHEVSGLLSAEHDVVQMTRNLARILGNPILRENFGEQGRRIVKNNFSQSEYHKNLEQVISGI